MLIVLGLFVGSCVWFKNEARNSGTLEPVGSAFCSFWESSSFLLP